MLNQSIKYLLCGVAVTSFLSVSKAETPSDVAEYAIQNQLLRTSEGIAIEATNEEQSACYPSATNCFYTSLIEH